jgi:hypothetical protein
MSHQTEGTYDVYEEIGRTARKPRRCSACNETIRPGNKYIYVAMLYDGEWSNVTRCLRCQRIHDHLKSRCRDSHDQLWPNERLNCGESYQAIWEEDPPEEIAALAFALPGEVK